MNHRDSWKFCLHKLRFLSKEQHTTDINQIYRYIYLNLTIKLTYMSSIIPKNYLYALLYCEIWVNSWRVHSFAIQTFFRCRKCKVHDHKTSLILYQKALFSFACDGAKLHIPSKNGMCGYFGDVTGSSVSREA